MKKEVLLVFSTMIFFFANTNAQNWSLTGNAGTSSTTNFLGTTDNVSLKFRTYNSVRMVIGNTGNVSVGTTVSSLAKFTTTGAVGNTTAIFGIGTTGISLQQSYPGISFNSYYNAGYKALSFGYGGNFTLDPSNGKLHYRAINYGAGTGSAQTYSTPLVITNGGTVGINNINPSPSVDLHVGSTTGARLQIGDQSQLVDGGNMILEVSSTFRPTANNAYRLGGSSWRWIDIWSVDGTINTSDKRDKTNIRDIQYGLTEIMKLHPVVFNWKDAPERGDKLGLIAQELETVIREAVVSKSYTKDLNGNKEVTNNDRLGVYYSDLTPVMIKAIQEQQLQIQSKDEKIQLLENELTSITERLNQMEHALDLLKIANPGNTTFSDAHLYQNAPNPFKEKSVIRFYIPGAFNNAELSIYTSDGKRIKSYRISKGENQIEIAGGTIPAGIYNYTLFINGRVAGSKQMVLIQ